MKYRGVKTLPNSVSTWLEQKLEDQGIDSSIYSRYVISLLQHDSVDIADLPDLFKSGRGKTANSWQNFDPEELKRSVVVNCLSAATDQASGIETLVDELCVKLKEVESDGSNCLKEKAINSRKVNSFCIESSPDPTVTYYSAFPALSKASLVTHQQTSSWLKSPIGPSYFQQPSLASSKKKESTENSSKENKISKRKDSTNKENIVFRGRMRSRSTTAKQQIQQKGMTRASAAKSLDRKDEEGNKCKLGKHYSFSENKGRKCLSFREEESFSRTPAPRNSEKFEDLSGCDKDLPMDFQQLLQSPEEDRILRDKRTTTKRRALHSGNFIQCGTNITSSIWSTDSSEKMDEDCPPELQEMNTIPWDYTGSTAATGRQFSENFPTWKGMSFLLGGCAPTAEDEYTMWSDVEGTTLTLGTHDNLARSFFSSLGDTEATYNGLNHNKDSSFTEVKPSKPPLSQQSAPVDSKLQPQQSSAIIENISSNQEEDLLTSMKTHFRPIRQDSYEKNIVGTATVTAPHTYTDGTTFVVSTSLEKIEFDRSESGALYLGCKELKYMEYKDAESSNRGCGEFVPKFRVRQNEKFCQTEENNHQQQEHSLGNEENSCEFYFPGDERLAEDMVNRLVDDDDDDDDDNDNVGNGNDRNAQEEENRSCSGLGGGRNSGTGDILADGTTSIRVDGWVTAWPIGGPSSAIWSNDSTNQNLSSIDKLWVLGDNKWSEGESVVKDRGEKCGGGGVDNYMQLRHELTEEGEELLSDLSSIHLFLDPDAPATPPTQAYYPKRMRIRPCPFRSENDSLL